MTEQAAHNTRTVLRQHCENLIKQPTGFFTHFPQNQYCECDHWEDCGHIGHFASVVYRLDDNLNYLSCEVSISNALFSIELHTHNSQIKATSGNVVVFVPFPKEKSNEVDRYFENECSVAKYNH